MRLVSEIEKKAVHSSSNIRMPNCELKEMLSKGVYQRDLIDEK